MSESEKSSHFNSVQIEEAFPEGFESHYWGLTRCQIVFSLLKELAPSQIVLDVGCGAGMMVQFLSSNSIETYGYEPSTHFTKSSKKDLFYCQGLEKLPPFIREKITTILLLDVIEHLENPDQLLLECQKHLPNLRFVLITVPACRNLWSQFDLFYGHQMRYEIPDLLNYFKRNHITSLKISYFFHALYWAALLLKFLGQERSTKAFIPRSRGVKMFHRLLASFFSLEFKLLPSASKGSSCIALGELRRGV